MEKEAAVANSGSVPKDPKQHLVIWIAAVAAVVASCGAADQAATPVETATAFVEAYSALDLETATSYLAEDANLRLFNADSESLPVAFRWDEASGFKVLLDSCAETRTGPAGSVVRCDYDYHGIRSEEIGLGPYSGSWVDITVVDGKITSAFDHLEFESNGFSSELWEPFATWVAENHPDDVIVMYGDPSQSSLELTDESVALWEQRTREYVEELGG
jgi:hypothetical protein